MFSFLKLRYQVEKSCEMNGESRVKSLMNLAIRHKDPGVNISLAITEAKAVIGNLQCET